MSRKHILPLLLVLGLLIVLVPACGGGEEVTLIPTSSPTATPVATATATPVPTSTPMLTLTPTLVPTATPTPTLVPTITPTPTPTATPVITATPTPIVPSTTELPCRFRGTVQLNGANVPNYTPITATILGYVYTTVTPSLYGDSTYIIKISPPEGTIFNVGTQITFKVGDYVAQQTGSWERGGNIQLNLTAVSP